MGKRSQPEFKVVLTQSPDAKQNFDDILNSKEMKAIVHDIIITKKALKSSYQ